MIRPRGSAGRAAVLLIAAAGVVPASAGAQRVVRAGVTVAHVDHRVDAGTAGVGAERSAGFVVGGEARVEWSRRFAVAVAASAGALDADVPGGLDRDLAQLDARVEFAWRPWLALEAGVTVRSYSTIVARQRWTLARAGGELRVPLSGDALRVVGRASLLPVVSVAGLPRPDLAVESAVGFAYARGRWAADLRFKVERCDFSLSGGSDRIEQLGTVTLGASLRIPGLSGDR